MPNWRRPPSPDPVPPRNTGLYTIIAIKSGKAALFLLVSLGLFSILGGNVQTELARLLRLVSLNPEREFWAALGRQLQSLSPEHLRWLASGTLLYGALLLVESIGLALRGWWAVWLAIGETAFFIPIELFDLVKHPSRLVTAILLVNLLIVAYLVRNRARLFTHHHK